MKSLTWDRGLEMADHKRFSVDTGVPVYFADPKSPWQRGSNENTKGLLRQYFPHGTNFRPITQAQLDEVEARLNGRLEKPSAGAHHQRNSASCCSDPLRSPSLTGGAGPRLGTLKFVQVSAEAGDEHSVIPRVDRCEHRCLVDRHVPDRLSAA
jgi:hypothetical protein